MGGWRFETGAVQEGRERSFDSLCSLRMTGKGDLAWIRRRMAQGLRKNARRTDCHTSDIGHWLAMTCFGRLGADSPEEGAERGFPLISRVATASPAGEARGGRLIAAPTAGDGGWRKERTDVRMERERSFDSPGWAHSY